MTTETQPNIEAKDALELQKDGVEIMDGENAAKEAVRLFHIEKLQDPHIGALFKYLRDKHALWDRILATYKKRDTFVESSHRIEGHEFDATPDRIRLLAPLISAIATMPEARANLQLLLDEAVQAESNLLKEQIEQGHDYVQRLVIGGGIMGAVFNAEFLHHAPEVSRLTVEQSSRLGGQFRQYGDAVIAMNTQNAPINRALKDEVANIDPNSFGPHSPIELEDLSPDIFADNEMIGLASALNQYLSGLAIVDNKSYNVTRNEGTHPGKYKVEIKENDSGASYEVYTDGIITLSGLGMPSYGLHEADQTTQQILDTEKTNFEQTKKAKVLTYADFMNMVGDPTNDFPLEPFVGKRVLIVGGGHSAFTAAEMLAHMGPEYRGSVGVLGGPCEIVIIGTRFHDRKEFAVMESPRYGQLGDVMVRDNQGPERKDPLITLVPGGRVKQLRTAGDSFRVLYGQKDQPAEQELESLDADYVIFTTGFENDALGMFKDVTDGGSIDEKVENFPFVSNDKGAPVARYLPGNPDIVFGGVAAKMAQGKREANMADVYNTPKNPASMFSNMRNTVELAQMIASQAKEERLHLDPATRELSMEKRERSPVELIGKPFRGLTFEVNEETAARQFPTKVDLTDFLSINLRAELSRFTLPSETQELKLVLRRETSQTGVRLVVEAPELDQGFSDLIQTLFEDEMNQALVARLTDPALRRSPNLSLVIDLNRKKDNLRL